MADKWAGQSAWRRKRSERSESPDTRPPVPAPLPTPPPPQPTPETLQQQLAGMFPTGAMPGIGGPNFGGIDPNQMYPGASYFGQGQQPGNVMTPQHAQSGGFASIFGAPGPMGLSGLFGGQ